MGEKNIIPYRLERAFFISLQFARPPQMLDATPMQFAVNLIFEPEELPDKFQINLRIQSEPDAPLTISAELVGCFGLVEGQPQPDDTIVADFVAERALFQLWPLVRQMVGMVTGQMGIDPYRLPTAHSFHMLSAEVLERLQPAPESEEEEC